MYLWIRSRAVSRPQFPSLHFLTPATQANFKVSNLSSWYIPYEGRILKIYVSVKSKLQHAPPPPSQGIPRAFDAFAVPGRREFDYQSFPGGGKFGPHALGVGDLNCTLDFM